MRPVAGSEDAWPRLVEEIARWDGPERHTAIISMEFLGPTPVEDIERVVSSLAPADVRVVLTVRDLSRNIPAMWQEGLKNGNSWHWREFLEDIERPRETRTDRAKKFWRHMNYPFIARRWMEVVGADAVTVVTVPHPGADPRLLWDRFCSVVGLDPAPFDVSGRSNTSLGAASAQVLRALNEALPEGMPLAHYQRVVKHALAKQGLSEHAALEEPIGFADDWVADRAGNQIRRLEELGLRVVGDLEELRPVPAKGVDPSEVPAGAQLEAAIDALRYLVEVWPSP